MRKIDWKEMYKMESAVLFLVEQAFSEIYDSKRKSSQKLSRVMALTFEFLECLKAKEPESIYILQNIYNYLETLRTPNLTFEKLDRISNLFCSQAAIENGYKKDINQRWCEYQDKQTIDILTDVYNSFNDFLIATDEFPVSIKTLESLIIKSTLSTNFSATTEKYIKGRQIELHNAFIQNLRYFLKLCFSKIYTIKKIYQILEQALKKTVEEQTFYEIDITDLTEYFEVDCTENPDDCYEEYFILPKS